MNSGVREIHFEGKLDVQKLQDILERETGKEVKVTAPEAYAIKAKSLEEAKTRVAVSNKVLDVMVAAK